MLHKLAHWPIPAAAGAALLVGLLCGFVNGLFITKTRVHPLLVTLATLSLYRGLAEGLSLGISAALHVNPVYSNFPESFTHLAQHALLAGPNPASPPIYALAPMGWLFLLAAPLAALLLAKTPFGRTLYATGFNETAARFSGLRVDRAKLLIYSLSGLTAAIVALNYCAYNDSAQASTGTGIELDVITAVVLGGTSIFGGRGRILGTILGVALIHETREFVSWHFHQNELVRIVLGALLILAVASNALLTRKSSRS